MNCPRCKNEMMEIMKHGVVIDVCSSCGGMWLDKGELAKIAAQLREAEASVDRELAAIRDDSQYRRDRVREDDKYGRRDHEHYDGDHEYRYHKDHKYRKKSGFERLFDIFD